MGLAARALGGCVALACAASLSGGASVPILERAVTPAPGDFDLASLGGPSQTPPERQSPAADVRVSVTEVETEVDVEVVDSTGSVLGESRTSSDFTAAAGATGIPAMVFAAYQAAAERLATEDPSCGLRWQVLAGIGKVESSHVRGGQLNAAGVNVPRIIGPVLNGGPGVAAISDSDGGNWDGDAVWDRAVGPMQFIPGTWRGYGADGDGDGVSDPHNVWDATLAAGRYLCAGGGDLRTTSGLRSALYRYNHSSAYVNHVLGWINAYLDDEPSPTPDRGPGDPARTGSDDKAAREPEDPEVPKPGGNDDDQDDPKDPKKPKNPKKPDDPKDPEEPKEPEDPKDPEPAVVPDLFGKKLAAARQALEDLALTVKVVEQEVEDTAQVGRVLKQNPDAGSEAVADAVVTLTVGVEPEPELVAVPDVVGMAEERARSEIEDAGLAVGDVTYVETSVEADQGVVLEQDPADGAEVGADAVVTLTVGAPPDPEPVVVPNVLDTKQAEARSALEDLGLVVKVVERVVEDESKAGRVLEQDPVAESEVAAGAEVTLTVGIRPE